ncbi:MAG TPA: KTSC domain-containing protein [Thermoanaerobaculia bacterium]|nr:KTSC domain-containing protein [Thermoanaerobaculia bacterium]
MRRQRVDSSAISSMGYDARSSTLEVEFRSGAVYDYHGVPPKVWKDLLGAPSKGRFFSRSLRGRYPSTRQES